MTDDGFTLPVPYNLAVDFVDRHLAEGRGGKVAIRTEGRALTYAEVAALVNRVAGGLRALGVEEEQRTLLLLPDSPEFAAAYFGTIKMGGVAIPTNTALRGPDYAYFLDESRARVLFVHSSLWPEVEPILRGRPHLKHVIVTGEARPGAMFWDTWLAGQPEEAEAAVTHPDDVAFWLWTSGSTGQPKGAVHLQQDWTWCCRNYAEGILDLSEDDVTFSSSKLFHAYGLGNALLFPFGVGATTVLHPGKPRPADLLRIVRSREAEHLLLGADPLRDDAPGDRGREPLRPLVACASGSAPPSLWPRTSSAGGRTASASRSSTASAPPRCSTSTSRRAPGR